MIGDINWRLDDLERKVRRINVYVFPANSTQGGTNYQPQIDEINDRLDADDDSIHLLQEEVSDINDEVDTINSSITTINNNITTISGQTVPLGATFTITGNTVNVSGNTVIKFNNQLNQVGTNFSFNASNGEINIVNPGSYHVSMFININGSESSATNVAMKSGSTIFGYASSKEADQVSGFGIITTTTPNQKITIQNNSSSAFIMNGCDTLGLLTIFRI